MRSMVYTVVLFFAIVFLLASCKGRDAKASLSKANNAPAAGRQAAVADKSPAALPAKPVRASDSAEQAGLDSNGITAFDDRCKGEHPAAGCK